MSSGAMLKYLCCAIKYKTLSMSAITEREYIIANLHLQSEGIIKKYVKINAKVCKHTWQSMLRCFAK